MKSKQWLINREIFGLPQETSTGGGGSGVNGGVFITNITPTGAGNVGLKSYSSGGVVLDSCITDTQLVTIHILAITGNTNYQPSVVLRWGTSYISVPVTPQVDKPLFSGSIAINLGGATQVTAEHEDGATHICNISSDAPPIIVSANFIGGYPGSQTELKQGDTYQFNIVSDIPIIRVEVADYGAYAYQSTAVPSNTSATITGVIANRGTTTQLLGARVRVQKSTGSWSAWHLTESDGSVNGLNRVQLNNIYPTVTCGLITYPITQSALKGAEVATILNVVTNFTTVVYDSPNNELSIASPALMQSPKSVTRINGSYNVTTPNFRITANRAANNATSTASTIVQIANIAAEITVLEPATRLRSGGNDGTAIQSHVITISSNQLLLSAPMLNIGAEGVWEGAGFTGSGATWTRNLQVHDDMTKGTYAWGSLSATNLAGIATSVITGNTDYILGGFVTRVITLPAYSNEVYMNVQAITYANVSMTWSVKALPNKRPVGTTLVPDANSWCLDTLNDNPTLIRILDTAATSASSSPSTITIQETI